MASDAGNAGKAFLKMRAAKPLASAYGVARIFFFLYFIFKLLYQKTYKGYWYMCNYDTKKYN